MTTRMYASVALAVGALVLGGCGASHGDEHGAGTTATRSVVNPSTFPLYRESSVVNVVHIDVGPMLAAIKRNDPGSDVGGAYDGHEIVASTSASLPQLRAWVGRLVASPPDSLVVKARHANSTFSGDPFAASGAAATFAAAGDRRVVMLVALDPKEVRARLGPVLGAIGHYRDVPELMRGPLDDAAKKAVGSTISEMLSPQSPLGVLLGSVDELANADRREIVLIEETKR